MKLQYLGDSKDSFKWDYHDYLADYLDYSRMNIAFMMTPDDVGNDGNTRATLYPARREVLDFCQAIRHPQRQVEHLNKEELEKSIVVVRQLPVKCSARYEVEFHNGGFYFDRTDRSEYFSSFSEHDDQLIFLDPDNGFEPEIAFNSKHVRYRDLHRILEQVSEESVISVFQHHRRINFRDDFTRIRERITTAYSTAIYWHSLMFVAASKSEKAIERVIKANQQYAERMPVNVFT